MYNSARRGPTYMIPTTGPVAAACVVAVNAAMTTGTRHALLKAAIAPAQGVPIIVQSVSQNIR
jgi:hypothetical protein